MSERNYYDEALRLVWGLKNWNSELVDLLRAAQGELEATRARAEAAERRAMVAERRLAAGPAAVAMKRIDDYGRAQWVNGCEAKFRISYAEWFQGVVELGEVQPEVQP